MCTINEILYQQLKDEHMECSSFTVTYIVMSTEHDHTRKAEYQQVFVEKYLKPKPV